MFLEATLITVFKIDWKRQSVEVGDRKIRGGLGSDPGDRLWSPEISIECGMHHMDRFEKIQKVELTS